MISLVIDFSNKGYPISKLTWNDILVAVLGIILRNGAMVTSIVVIEWVESAEFLFQFSVVVSSQQIVVPER